MDNYRLIGTCLFGIVLEGNLRKHVIELLKLFSGICFFARMAKSSRLDWQRAVFFSRSSVLLYFHNVSLTLAGKVTNLFSSSVSLKISERSEVKSAKRSFALKYSLFRFLTRSFASRFLLRYAQPFLAKLNWTINFSLSQQGLNHFFWLIFQIFSLGLFSCITGLVAAWKDHHFIYINVIWLASFIAASYLIKLIWELIFYFLTAPSQTWLIWIKYICGLIIYTFQGFFHAF